ncbi:hypothetical protein EDB87DRAFT_1584840 [Lactarius vividus]|nr:hypothetical protein EDB87DRAFT_1584840 [Lactarius vividus]
MGLRRYPRNTQKRRFLIFLIFLVVLSNSCLSFHPQLPLHLALPSAHYSPIIFPMQLSLPYVLPILVFLVLCMIWAVLVQVVCI